jgi:hypothetical protein
MIINKVVFYLINELIRINILDPIYIKFNVGFDSPIFFFLYKSNFYKVTII